MLKRFNREFYFKEYTKYQHKVIVSIMNKYKKMFQNFFILICILSLLIFVILYSYSKTKKYKIPKDNYSLKTETQNNKEKLLKVELKSKIFGYSVRDRPIIGYEVGEGENVLLLIGAIHGNEKSSANLLNRFVEEIKTNTNIISKTKKIIIIPIANPDGYYDETDSKLNANEVNLDWNFPGDNWQDHSPTGISAGTHPFSEPETQIIQKVIEEYKPNAFISYHAIGAFVSPEFDNTPSELGMWYANKTGYVYDDNNEVWDFPATATKWFITTTKNPAITVELTDYFDDDWLINKDALIELTSSNNPLPKT